MSVYSICRLLTVHFPFLKHDLSFFETELFFFDGGDDDDSVPFISVGDGLVVPEVVEDDPLSDSVSFSFIGILSVFICHESDFDFT